VTSLPGITASITAALDGRPALAVSNAVGGIAAQTLFIAVADVFHRKANLEHAAASVVNLMQATLLVFILSLVMLVMLTPEQAGPAWLPMQVGHVHLATPLIVLVYVWGYVKVYRGGQEKMWRPRFTEHTREDTPDEESDRSPMWKLWAAFALTGVVVFIAGVFTARVGGAIVDQTPLTESVVGLLFTAVATSLPELISAVTAVRRGALQLAVGDIVGGNAFDCLFICAADVAFFGGSIYHAAGPAEMLLVASGLTMSAVLLMGLLHREKQGIGGVGFEAWAMLAVYAVTVVVVATGAWPDG
jgi:cation:H+ antiporter